MAQVLAGKVAIITGAASGIGLATAHLFLASGVDGLALVDLSSEALEAATSSLTSADKERVLLIAADVSNEADTERYVQETVKRFGRLDISVQNAGITQAPVGITDLSAEDFDRLMRVNVRAPFLGVKHSARAMKSSPSKGKGCSIVLTGSQLGLDGAPLLAGYCASKFAVRGISLVAATELGEAGIRVNTVAPGPVSTPMLAKLPADALPGFEKQVLLQRFGKASEIAQTILFLASDQASWITASTFKVDGGFSKWA